MFSMTYTYHNDTNVVQVFVWKSEFFLNLNRSAGFTGSGSCTAQFCITNIDPEKYNCTYVSIGSVY